MKGGMEAGREKERERSRECLTQLPLCFGALKVGSVFACEAAPQKWPRDGPAQRFCSPLSNEKAKYWRLPLKPTDWRTEA